jgi:hypothetical protein
MCFAFFLDLVWVFSASSSELPSELPFSSLASEACRFQQLLVPLLAEAVPCGPLVFLPRAVERCFVLEFFLPILRLEVGYRGWLV